MKNIIFDMDGVLMDSFLATNEAFSKMKFRGNTLEEVTKSHLEYCSQKPWHAKDQVFDKSTYDMIAERLNVMFDIVIKDPRYKPFAEFLKEIEKINDKRIAVVSSNSKKHTDHFRKLTNLQFTHILNFIDSPSKEDKVNSVLQSWNIGINDFYYITDTLADVYELEGFMPKEHIIGCSWGYCGYELLAKELPTNQILKEFKEIHKAIK